ncbi:WD40/YVTN/BNR-like repeat-containing protein [Janibacter sp. G1551]|uniref:WD40/YVTN/BNR-like repeat-containing protein n=1 Tax=Janibacter sp. G1551 TaxID=3420440 RepID=UPI003D075CCC
MTQPSTLRRLLAVGAATALAMPLATSAVAAPPSTDADWDVTVVDPDQGFRGLDAVDRDTAWVTGGSASGGEGGVFRTTNGGAHWEDVRPAGSEGLMFRDVEARDAETAVVLAIGPGEASRIYRTTDGGATWAETFRNTEEAAFYNCVDFAPGGRDGLAVSDPVDGRFRILRTADGGASWEVLPTAGMPDSTGEFNFSASGDCLVMDGRDAWFGSGGADSRVFHSRDLGMTWTATDSGLPAGEAAGVFGMATKNPRQAVVVGGDFAAPDNGTDAAATTRDGATWTGGGDVAHLGEDAAFVPGTRATVLAVGQGGAIGGTSRSLDGGRTWTQVSDEAFHTLDCTNDGSCWAAGGGGRVGRLDMH